MPWWNERMCGFDLETTSPVPEEARIVTAAIAFCGGGQPTETWYALADAGGVDIPEEATAVHGVSTQRAREEGRPEENVVKDVVDLLRLNIARGVPIVVFNARYDLTVIDRLCRRYLGHGLLWQLGEYPLRCVDPAVLDKQLDRYRKSYPYGHTPESAAEAGIISSRTLEGMCAVYGARLEGAHDATFDAIAACRLAWCIGAKGTVKRRRMDAEAQQTRAEWEAARDDLDRLTNLQRTWAMRERVRFAEYKRTQGEHETAERIEAEKGWPVLGLFPWETAAAGVS